jgi:hypothetical protein
MSERVLSEEDAGRALAVAATEWLEKRVRYYGARGVRVAVSFAGDTEARWKLTRASDGLLLSECWVKLTESERLAELEGVDYYSF